MFEQLVFDGFLYRALFAGIGIALAAGAVGSFIIWRKMAYFGDSLAHNALLGAALGILVGVSTYVSILVASIIFAVLLVLLRLQRLLAADAALGVLSHVSLSIGLIVLTVFLPNIAVESYLFGDILTVRMPQIYWIYGVCAGILLLLYHYWQPLLLITLNEDLARAEGIVTERMHWLFVLMMILLVAVSIRIVGVLLITSLLIIPAASARQLVRTPVMMMCIASLLGVLAVCLGISASFYLDTPSGPTIVVAAALLFVVSISVRSVRHIGFSNL